MVTPLLVSWYSAVISLGMADAGNAEAADQAMRQVRGGASQVVLRLERRGGEWKIALRTNIIEWGCLPPAMPLPFGDVPDIAVNGVSSRSKDDPSYMRPLVNRRERQIP